MTPVHFALTSGCFLELRKFTPIECSPPVARNLKLSVFEGHPDTRARSMISTCFDRISAAERQVGSWGWIWAWEGGPLSASSASGTPTCVKHDRRTHARASGVENATPSLEIHHNPATVVEKCNPISHEMLSKIKPLCQTWGRGSAGNATPFVRNCIGTC